MPVRPFGFGEARRSGGYFRDTLFQDRDIRERLRSCHGRACTKPRTLSMERRYPTLSPGSLRFVGHACTHCNLTAPSTGLLPPLWRRKNGTRPYILIGRVPRGFA